jgi:hypothetical protein
MGISVVRDAAARKPRLTTLTWLTTLGEFGYCTKGYELRMSILSISSRSFDAFRGQATENFIVRTLKYLRDVFRSRDVGPLEPIDRQLVLEGIERAREFGLESERDIAKFIVVTVWLGKSFVKRAEPLWLTAILAYPHFDRASDRIEAIYRAVGKADGSDAPKPD